MIHINCPYCEEKIDILFGEEIGNLLRKGVSDCKCDHCEKIFEIYQGKDQYETRVKEGV